jgi:hypothetical protein
MAEKGQQIFMVAVGAAYTGESLCQITAPEIGAHHIGDHWAKISVTQGKPFWVE